MLQDIAVVVLLLPVATTGLLLDSLEYRNCSTPLGNAPLDNEASELASSQGRLPALKAVCLIGYIIIIYIFLPANDFIVCVSIFVVST